MTLIASFWGLGTTDFRARHGDRVAHEMTGGVTCRLRAWFLDLKIDCSLAFFLRVADNLAAFRDLNFRCRASNVKGFSRATEVVTF